VAKRCKARGLSRSLLVLWGWLVAVSASLGGCSSKSEPSARLESQATETGVSSPLAMAPEEVWREALEWAQSPDGDGVIECEVPIPDEWLAALPSTSQWRGFHFLAGGPGEVGLSFLAKHRPQQLVVRGVRWGEIELAEIRRWKSLVRLDIDAWSGVGGDVFDARGFEGLRSLRLVGDRATQVDWESLRCLSELKHLHLVGISVGDEGVASFGQLDSLESLYLNGADCSPAALEGLLEANPSLHLHVDDGHF